ncbi:MAG: hypothetical protein ACP5J8_02000 [Minisyncoccia bacterium]
MSIENSKYFTTGDADGGPEKNNKQNILDIISNAEVVINQKELDPKDKIELLNDYAKKLAELTKNSPEKIYLTELIKDKNKLNEFVNGISQIKRKEQPLPETVKQTQEFIKQEFIKKEDKNKQEDKNFTAFWNKIGGLETLGTFLGMGFLFFIILIILGEFKLLEKATNLDLNLNGGGKGKK